VFGFKVSKSANMTKTNFFFEKMKKDIKNAEFLADLEFFEKVVKQCTKKSYKQNKSDEHE
jgi:hypothetical protein